MVRLFSFLVLVSVLTGCADSPKAIESNDRIIRLSDAEIKSLDPQTVSDLASLRVAMDQFEGLTRFDANGKAEAGLAKSWRVSPDGLRWQFDLRRNLAFSDGTAITGALFPKVLARLRQDALASPTRNLFDNITGITSQDPMEVEVTLALPDPALPELLAHPAMAAIPVHLAGKGQDWTTQRPLVTSGPYRTARWQLNSRLELAPNPRWHEGRPPTPHIIWQPMDDSLTAMRLFLSGGADIAGDFPVSRHDWLRENHPMETRSVPYLGAYYFAFNTRQPPFNDRRIRIALSMAVEREWIANRLIGIGNPPAWGILPPGLALENGYRPVWADWPRERRLAAARVLLAQAGVTARNPLNFEIRFNSSSEHRRVSVALAAMWKPLHVEASLFNSEAALHFASLRRGDFSLARSGWIADLATPENFLAVHKSDAGPTNYSGYSNTAFDAALTGAMAIADPEQRRNAMARAEKMLMADSPILPLYFTVTRSLVSPRIHGWQDNFSNMHPSRTLALRRR
jgi:peptide/nickel transport system substrate-binding protein/oligopeptide transport system substrate-binding protein